MESFLTTLPPYVHQYIDKYPPTECFNILKELICFAVLYSNDRERTNILSLELLQKGADGAVTHKPYISSESALSTLSASATSTDLTSPHYLSPVSVTKTIPPTIQQQHSSEQLDFECSTILEEQGVLDSRHIATVDMDHAVPAAHSTAVDGGRKSTMPYTFPEWWAHPDSGSNDGLNNYAGKNITRSESPLSSNKHKVSDDTPKQLTTTQEMNITNWIPIDFSENTKSNRNQTTTRPTSLYNPTIPDLRSYLGKTEQTNTNKPQAPQANGSTKVSRQMTVPALPLPGDASGTTIAPALSKPMQQLKQSVSSSRSPPRVLTKSVSTKTTTSSAVNQSSNPTTTSVPLSRSSSTRSTASSSTTTSSKAYRPGQTATVRARAEQAKQRQLQLEEEKRKQAASTLSSRTSLRLRQQAASGIDWESIKKDRRKTMPVTGLNS